MTNKNKNSHKFRHRNWMMKIYSITLVLKKINKSYIKNCYDQFLKQIK